MKIIIAAYFVIQILVLSSLMVLQIKLTLHLIMIAFSSSLYLLVSFKKPGYFKTNTKIYQLSDELKNKNKHKPNSIVQIDQANSQQQRDSDQNIQNKTNKSIKVYLNIPQNNQNQQNQRHKSLYHIKIKQQKINKNKSKKQYQIKTNCAQKVVKLSKNQRYCIICKVIQPDRVRHCHQCHQCIYTFDHHCPWMDTCIGEKNRIFFWLFLFIQFIQFLCVDISVLNAITDNKDLKHVYFFFIALLMTTFVSLAILLFHTYLAILNLTTWEYVRWDKIQYLNQHPKQNSPFSYGWKNNIYHYCISSWQNQPFQWIKNHNQITPHIRKNKKLQIKSIQKPQTQRKISKSKSTQIIS